MVNIFSFNTNCLKKIFVNANDVNTRLNFSSKN